MKKRNTLDEMVVIVQARKAGKTIQYWSCHEQWEDTCGEPLFNFGNDYYRVKPEPQVVYIREYSDGSIRLEKDSPQQSCYADSKVRKFVEVLD